MFQNTDRTELIIEDEDVSLRLLNSIYSQDLQAMKSLEILKLERCKIDRFEPKDLMETLKHISLQGNKIKDIDLIQFGS